MDRIVVNAGCSICRDWARMTPERPSARLAAFPCDNCGGNLCDVWLAIHPDRSPTPAIIVPPQLARKIAEQMRAAFEGGHKVTAEVHFWVESVLREVKP